MAFSCWLFAIGNREAEWLESGKCYELRAKSVYTREGHDGS